MPTESEILAALAGVTGPDGRTSLPDSGAIDGITVRDDKVFIAMRIDPAKAQAMAPMQQKVEAPLRRCPASVRCW